MSYIFTIILLLSVMNANFIPAQLVVPVCFIGVLFIFIKEKLLLLKSLGYVHLLWIIFFSLLGLNYWNYNSNQFSEEFLLYVCLAGSMYVGMLSGIKFKKQFLYIFCIWIFIIQFQLYTKNSMDQFINERWSVTTGWLNSNAVGAILAFSIPLILLCFQVVKIRWVKLLLLLQIGISILGIFMLSSRGSFLALSIVVVYFCLTYGNSFKNIIITMVSMFIFTFLCLIIDPLQEAIQLTFERFSSSGLNGRELLWEEAINLIKNNPLYGIGARNGNNIDFHNPMLQVGAHYGLPTVVPFTFLIFSPMLLIRLTYVKGTYISFVFATYLALVIQSLIEAILNPFILGCLSWYFIGLTYGLIVKFRHFNSPLSILTNKNYTRPL